MFRAKLPYLLHGNDLAPNGLVFARYSNGGYNDAIGAYSRARCSPGSSILFELYNPDGGWVEWFGPTACFLFFTATPVSETNSIVLLTTAMDCVASYLRDALRDDGFGALAVPFLGLSSIFRWA